ncbi:fungal zn(2)-Cys(6) binuclear cluster domain-containing protein [Rhizoctonia solani AG-1 IA]|uniref:Fungal zn(2)-Cys(6) binuclear cluster domain-containing protein n=1 Tax=Thanatephorus cucumeris (strain AG1-IA) TaxID=983506 RepID=L8WIK8_THACA|nr:fungal zn(2)-Cys(6) binuclear cluster domain-containing protein [Rhizoctonia solani AG-1 IA]
MSFPSNPDCGTCKARKIGCDRTWGPAGCRRCAEEGLECRRRIPRLKNSARGIEAINTGGRMAYHSRTVFHSIRDAPSNMDSSCNKVRDATTSVGLLAPRPLETSYSAHWSGPSRQTTRLTRQLPTPPAEIAGPFCGSAAPTHLVTDSTICSHTFTQPLTSQSPRAITDTGGQDSTGEPNPSCDFQLQIRPDILRSGSDFYCEDPEGIQASLFDALSLDREVASNSIPFVLHSIAAGVIRFVFAPTQILSSIRDYVFQSRSYEQGARQRTLLISNMSLAISSTTDYDLTDYMTLQKQLIGGVTYARTCDNLTREVALEVMDASHELLCAMWRVGSLANVLHTMRLYAPIFRRACPEHDQELVNFPRLLITPNINIQYYATLDILQSCLTHRPMFFRYDLTFISPQIEELIKLDQGPGLRWLYGIPNRIMLVLAKMNTLLEDFGSCIDKEVAKELEDDIGACTSILPSSANTDPTLNMGRMMVQESWKLAAKLLSATELLATVFLTASADGNRNFRSHADRKMILARLWGVAECTKHGTVGNDLVMILRHVWLRTMHRPTVWSDLGAACSAIIGM